MNLSEFDEISLLIQSYSSFLSHILHAIDERRLQ